MIEQQAIILSIEETTQQTPIATIEVVRKTACGLCGKTRGCGNAFWGKLFGHKSTSLKAQNGIGAKVGQTVVVGIDEAALMKSAFLLYIVPLVTMFAGAILAMQFVDSDGSAMIGAVVGLVAGFLWVKAHTVGRGYDERYQPKILRLDVADSADKPIQFQ